MPYALHQAGFGLGLLLLLAVAVITDYSLVIMVRAAHISGDFTYQGIMRAAFGQPGFILLSILQFIYPYIAMVSYNIVVGDTVTKVLVRLTGMAPDSVFAHREVVTLLATFLITLPLCLHRDVTKLARVSFLSLLFVAAILLAIIARAPAMAPLVPPTEDAWQFANSDVVPAIGIMAFAFMCHHNTFLIYESMAQANQKRWDTVTHISVGTSAFVTFVFGIVGYATFTSWSQGDLLENYCWGDDLMNAARLIFSATILLTYPIECFVARDVLRSTVLANLPDTRVLHVALTLALLPAVATALFGATVAIVGTVMLVLHFSTASECSHGAIMSYCMIHTNATD
ncbi:hypothetical protein B566_EDAN003537 [Ephemera danica]|nr:hypothetical protein B566_EDAN003537 [Ephemera danica]